MTLSPLNVYHCFVEPLKCGRYLRTFILFVSCFQRSMCTNLDGIIKWEELDSGVVTHTHTHRVILFTRPVKKIKDDI